MSFAVPFCISYQDGQFLTARTMQTEADYFTNWITLQNWSLYNPGWLIGLEVSRQDGNRLAVTAGTGIDLNGRFLILPGDAVYTVPSSGVTNPSYLTLRYLTPQEIRAAAMQSQTLNMAAVLDLASTLGPPTEGIGLVKISLDANGGIADVSCCRTRVTSRIQPIGATKDMADSAPSPAMVRCQGTIDIPPEQLSKLKAPGDHAEMTVYYVRPNVPAFAAPPRVVASVRGPRPYAVNVDQVGNVSFVLRVTVFVAAETPETIAVDWMAMRT